MNEGERMIYIQYALLASVIVYATVSLSYYVDVIDKRTTISSALLGGILLAAITSLPELITSLTSAIYLNEGALAYGNVLGSNLFNILILAVVDLIFIKRFFFNRTQSQVKPHLILFLMYATFLIPLGLDFFGFLEASAWTLQLGFTINISSLIIIGLYAYSLKDLNVPEAATETDDSPLSMRQIMTRLGIFSAVVVSASVGITVLTDQIALALNLNQSFAGALLLGGATSLPELTAVIALFKLKNYTVALGNIIGSNAFNFLIIALTDVATFQNDLFIQATREPLILRNLTWLLLLGALNTIILAVALLKKPTKNTGIYYLFPASIIAVYITYLLVSI